jgi:hypothetical protein
MALIRAPVVGSFFTGLTIMKAVKVEEVASAGRRGRLKVGASILSFKSSESEGILYH